MFPQKFDKYTPEHWACLSVRAVHTLEKLGVSFDGTVAEAIATLRQHDVCKAGHRISEVTSTLPSGTLRTAGTSGNRRTKRRPLETLHTH